MVNKYSFLEENSLDTSIVRSTTDDYQWISPPTKNYKQKKKYSNLSCDHWKRSSSQLLPKYSQLSNYLFKNILSQNISCYNKNIEQCLTNPKIFQFIRQRGELMSVISQLKIEHDYWIYTLNLAIPAMKWLSTISKNLKQRNYINWNYPATVHNVLHRQKTIENKLINT